MGTGAGQVQCSSPGFSRISPARAGLRRYLPSGGDQGTAGISLFRLLPRARAGLAEPAGHLLHPMTVIRRRKGHEPTGIRCPSGFPRRPQPMQLGAHPQARDATVCPRARRHSSGRKSSLRQDQRPQPRPSGLGHPHRCPASAFVRSGSGRGPWAAGQDLCRCRGDSNAVKKIRQQGRRSSGFASGAHGLGPCPAGCGHHNESGSPRAARPTPVTHCASPIAATQKARPATWQVRRAAYPVMTKADHPKVPAAREQRPYLTASVAADHRDMTSTANAAQGCRRSWAVNDGTNGSRAWS